MKSIIFQNDEGGVSVIDPISNYPHLMTKMGVSFTVEQIAAKDVPTGKPYKIVDKSEVPTDRTFRNAWAVDEADLTDGVGAVNDPVTGWPVEGE